MGKREGDPEGLGLGRKGGERWAGKEGQGPGRRLSTCVVACCCVSRGAVCVDACAGVDSVVFGSEARAVSASSSLRSYHGMTGKSETGQKKVDSGVSGGSSCQKS